MSLQADTFLSVPLLQHSMGQIILSKFTLWKSHYY